MGAAAARAGPRTPGSGGRAGAPPLPRAPGRPPRAAPPPPCSQLLSLGTGRWRRPSWLRRTRGGRPRREQPSVERRCQACSASPRPSGRAQGGRPSAERRERNTRPGASRRIPEPQGAAGAPRLPNARTLCFGLPPTTAPVRASTLPEPWKSLRLGLESSSHKHPP